MEFGEVYTRGLGAIYFVAFASFFSQYPGLLGADGILPVDTLPNECAVLSARDALHVEVDVIVDAICLLGMVLSSAALLWWPWGGTSFSMGILFALYLSLVSVGQTFYSFQWDILLLEGGFLAILCAQATPWCPSPAPLSAKLLVRWLLFKLMLMSGAVKIQSGCETWLNLTALNYHYATQCIPTPLAWFAHHLPPEMHKLSVAATLVIELPGTLLILAPTAQLREVAFVMQSLLMLMIAMTGNYNFFNVLAVVLCSSLVDRPWFNWQGRSWKSTLSSLLVFVGVVVVAPACMFALHPTKWLVVAFSREDLSLVLSFLLPKIFKLWGGVIICGGLYGIHCTMHGKKARPLTKAVSCLFQTAVLAAAVFVFFASLVPFASIDRPTQAALPPFASEAYRTLAPYQAVSGYGLFRHMTGVGPRRKGGPHNVARPEVILEGTVDGKKWHQLEFMYKPGNVERPPPWIAPHQPRLDWQLWFAALGTYQHNPWFVHLCVQLMRNSTTVWDLLDARPAVFIRTPPVATRAKLFVYDFSPSNETKAWWQRKRQREYMPEIRLDNSNVQQFLRTREQDLKKRQRRVLPAPEGSLLLAGTMIEWLGTVGRRLGYGAVCGIPLSSLISRVLWRYMSVPRKRKQD